MKSIQDCYKLNNGVEIPCIGFGTYKVTDAGGAEMIREAVKCGYRYFDTAAFYKNEEELGRALALSGIPRHEIFLSSKVWKTDMGAEGTRRSFEESLRKLHTDYLDLFLIHWPRPDLENKNWRGLLAETWKAMEDLYRAGKIRAIGVSNFLPHHLDVLSEVSKICPAADQLEFHPGYTQEAAVTYCREKGILVQAWSPLGRSRVLAHPLIQELSGKYKVSPAQLCIRYALQRGVLPLPKASEARRMRENQDVFAFEIEREDMHRITSMPPSGWSGEHPDFEKACTRQNTF